MTGRRSNQLNYAPRQRLADAVLASIHDHSAAGKSKNQASLDVLVFAESALEVELPELASDPPVDAGDASDPDEDAALSLDDPAEDSLRLLP